MSLRFSSLSAPRLCQQLTMINRLISSGLRVFATACLVSVGRFSGMPQFVLIMDPHFHRLPVVSGNQ